jgi:hypothetical protein
MPYININKCANCGIKHQWLFDAPTLKELRDIKKLTGMGGNAFTQASEDGDPEALAALIYVLHKRDKITLPFDDVDLDFNELEIEPTEEEKAAVEKEAAAGEQGKASPSTGSGTTRKAG